MENNKTLVLVSGGLDSTVLLARAVQMVGSENVVALNIYYGQKHQKEMEYAEYQAIQKYRVQYIIADLSEVFKYDPSCPLLINSSEKMPMKSYAEQLAEMGGEGTVKTYIPFRNGLFLSYATAVAIQVNAGTILYGAHADDAAGRAYPDCTEDFIKAMAASINYGTGGQVKLEAPLKNMNKSQIVKMGIELGVDFAHTWSCYNGKEVPCGTCGTCIDRIAAFQANDMIDPLVIKLIKTHPSMQPICGITRKDEHIYHTESTCNVCGKPIDKCDRG